MKLQNNEEELTMNSLWNRFKYSVQADLHTVLDKKESKNPIAMLNQYIREAEKQTDSIGKLLERQSKLKTELQKELAEAEKMADKRRSQLELAQTAGEEDLLHLPKRKSLRMIHVQQNFRKVLWKRLMN